MKAVNLLPQDLRSGGKGPAASVSAGTQDAGGAGAFIVLGALALCVIALAGYVLTSNTVKARQASLADVSARSEATSREAATLKPYADFETMANARVATINDLAGSRFDWERSLRDLSHTLPADVTLSQLSGTLSSSSGSSGGGSALRGAINVPAIELQGCTAGQTDVATLMSRLRNVDGVTRVSLSKTDKEAPTTRSIKTSSAGASTTTAGGGAVNACGVGDSQPSFDVVMFFEGAAAQAADPAGLTTPGAPAPAAAAATAASAVSTATPTPSASGTTATTSTSTGASK
jgi:Tfp pilus assembly protein PilN